MSPSSHQTDDRQVWLLSRQVLVAPLEAIPFLCVLYGKVEGNLVSEEQLCVLSEMYFSGIRDVAQLLRVLTPVAKDRVLFSTPIQDGLNHQKIQLFEIRFSL